MSGTKPACSQLRSVELPARGLAAPAEPRLVGEVGDLDRTASGETVVRRQRQVHPFVDDRAHRDVGVGRERVQLEVVEDGHVVAAAAQGRQRLLGLGLGQAEADPGMGLTEPPDRPGDDRGAGAGEADEPELAGLEPRHRRQLALGLFEARHRRPCVGDEDGAGVGQDRAPAQPQDERLADLGLEGGDLLADRGLGDVELLGGSGERAVLGDGPEDAKSLQIQHE